MATVLKRLTACSAALVAALSARASLADDPKPAEPAKVAEAEAPPADPAAAPAETKPTRRNGFTIGVGLGMGVSSIAGFPNDVNKVGYKRWYTETGARPSPLVELWLGGAFTDWFVFSVGMTGSRLLGTGDNSAMAAAGIFHIEAYPLFWLGGRYRDLGIRIDAGAGAANVQDKNDKKLVESSAASLIGGGLFYEGIRFWKVSQGPFLMGNYMWSDTARRPAIFLGWRAAITAGP
jgi:hypothetical protein